MIGRGTRERERERDRDRDYRDRERDRFRDRSFYSPHFPRRSEEKPLPPPLPPHQRSSSKPLAPPSRHLWVGNLSHHISETALSEHFLRFGELESIAFQPGRSYAFVNFRKEEDAMIALRALQGFSVAGLPLRIEFAKAERSSAASHDEHQQWRDDRHSVERGASLYPRESRTHHSTPEPFYPEKSKMGDKNAETSEVLWIGFPSFLNVDEMVLRRAFSPFGEIEKITSFPGRSYAFVRFRTMVAACRAREALQGNLFNNPRVRICFAKSETGAPEHGRSSISAPFSPHFKSNGHPGRPTEFRQDRKIVNSTGGSHMGSPRFVSDLESGDSGMIELGRRSSGWTGGSGTYDPMRFPGPQSDLGLPQNLYEHHISPARERGSQRRDFSPGIHPRNNPFFEDPSYMQENAFLFRETKKQKTGPFPPDNELPEYPFADSAQEAGFSRTFLDFPENEVNDNYGSGSFGYKRIPDSTMNLPHPLGERDDSWKAPYDRLEAGFGSLPSNPGKKVFVPESHQPPLSEEWKWEGTIAKGGSPICRARCFPVGKVLDSKLPEFLDCTARTGLDMLAKHFYQASSSWVVFFVPEGDADITLYNEFMHFLGEKQRAAVAKLGEKTTLFLVPPSEFSEKVLKVPGKLSISGVILRFEHPGSDIGSLSHPLEAIDSKISFPEDIAYPKPISTDLRSSAWGQSQGSNSSSEPFPSLAPFASSKKPALDDLPFMRNTPGSASSVSYTGSHFTGRVSEPLNESSYYQSLQHRNPPLPPNWTPHHQLNANPGTGNLFPQVPSNSVRHSSGHTDIPFSGSSNISHQATQSQVSLSLPMPPLQSEQLAQLASLLGQRQQSGSGSMLSLEGDHKPSDTVNQLEETFVSSQKSLQNHALSDSRIHYGEVHPLLQEASNASTVPRMSSAEVQMGAPESQGNQPLQNSGAHEEEADPQRRLQATLQLAATLLQQIQQQAKAVDQR